MDLPDFEKMRHLSADIRIETVKEIAEAGFGHIGGSASIADVLAVLYGGVMRINPQDPNWRERDWLVLSKGHCGPFICNISFEGLFPDGVAENLEKGVHVSQAMLTVSVHPEWICQRALLDKAFPRRLV